MGERFILSKVAFRNNKVYKFTINKELVPHSLVTVQHNIEKIPVRTNFF